MGQMPAAAHPTRFDDSAGRPPGAPALSYNAPMNIGIISDIHGFLPDGVRTAFQECNVIINAGDTCSKAVMAELESIAPTVSIHGNCDRHVDYGPTVHDVARPSFEGVRFYVVHRPEDIPAELPDGTRVVVHGHTHVPREEEVDGVLYLNPGSPTEPRRGSEPGVMTLVVEEREVFDVQRIVITPFGLRRESDAGGLGGMGRFDDFDDFDPDEAGDHTHIDFGELF